MDRTFWTVIAIGAVVPLVLAIAGVRRLRSMARAGGGSSGLAIRMALPLAVVGIAGFLFFLALTGLIDREVSIEERLSLAALPTVVLVLIALVGLLAMFGFAGFVAPASRATSATAWAGAILGVVWAVALVQIANSVVNARVTADAAAENQAIDERSKAIEARWTVAGTTYRGSGASAVVDSVTIHLWLQSSVPLTFDPPTGLSNPEASAIAAGTFQLIDPVLPWSVGPGLTPGQPVETDLLFDPDIDGAPQPSRPGTWRTQLSFHAGGEFYIVYGTVEVPFP